MFDTKLFRILFLLALAMPALAAQNYLFYLEAQGVGGWSFNDDRIILFSMAPLEAMQKPSLGFDFIQKFSGSGGDLALLAVQARLVYNQDGVKHFEPQIFNAYLRFKFRDAGLWIGHNKPKLGLATGLDNHGTLLQPLSMMGFGFDRDWGIGFDRDYEGGSIGIALTTGSGMSLRFKGNFLASARIVKGVLGQDNHSLGFSAALGRILDVEGSELLSPAPQNFFMAGIDGSWLINDWEHSLDILAGIRDDRAALAVFWRTSLALLAEARLKLEVQPAWMLRHGRTHFEMALGASFLATADLTLRSLINYDVHTKDAKVMLQVYYYKGVRF
jgi:hypothetical protein